MIRLIPEKFASRGLVILFSLLIVFHLLVLTGIIPFQMVWGGRLKDIGKMYSFEAVSIVLNLLMLGVVAVRSGLVSCRINPLVIQILLWMMVALFILNTVGNLLSINETEKLIFTPLTLMLAIFCIRLALSKEKRAN